MIRFHQNVLHSVFLRYLFLKPSYQRLQLRHRAPLLSSSNSTLRPFSRNGAIPPLSDGDVKNSIRLSRLLSLRSLLSRREADSLLSLGDGTILVDDVPLDGGMSYVGMRVRVDAKVELRTTGGNEGDRTESQKRRRRVVLLHKPRGYVSHHMPSIGNRDDRKYPSGLFLLTRRNLIGSAAIPLFQPGGKRIRNRTYAPAGRLDVDSTGLMIYSGCGVVARVVTSGLVDKEYIARVRPARPGFKWEEANIDRLKRGGAMLQGSKRALLPMKLKWDVKVKKEGHYNIHRPPPLRIVVREGQKRMIRRMCEEFLNMVVVRLHRVRVGPFSLEGIAEGKWRCATEEEIKILMSLEKNERETR